MRVTGRLAPKQAAVFADALPEYADVQAVVQRLSTWRREFAQSYEDAYVVLSLPDVFGPFIRVEVRCVLVGVALSYLFSLCLAWGCSCCSGRLAQLSHR